MCVCLCEGTYHSAKSIQIRTEEPINWKEKQFVRPNCHRLWHGFWSTPNPSPTLSRGQADLDKGVKIWSDAGHRVHRGGAIDQEIKIPTQQPPKPVCISSHLHPQLTSGSRAEAGCSGFVTDVCVSVGWGGLLVRSSNWIPLGFEAGVLEFKH